jgi:thiosulfate/3-mercaptopyruvate sulfurtransferase
MKIFLLAFLLLFSADPWSDTEIVQPKVLADVLSSADGAKPPVFYVGFPVLYRDGAHIATATLAGPCSKAEGLEALKKAVQNLPHDNELYIYCGCCPFVKCPNIRPAYSALHEMGFSNLKVVMIETNLHTDWIEKGYPVEKQQQ